MIESLGKMDVNQIKQDLIELNQESSMRGLKQSAKWSAELLHSLLSVDDESQETDDIEMVQEDANLCNQEVTMTGRQTDASYLMAKCCYDVSEYDRGSFYGKGSKCPEGRFLYYYCRYMAAEKKKLDLMAECSIGSNGPSGSSSSGSQLTTTISSSSSDVALALFKELRHDLNILVANGEADSYILYVYAIVLLKLDLNLEAVGVLVQSIKSNNLNWASWNQLAVIIDNHEMLLKLSQELPVDTWIKKLFEAIVLLELQMNEEALMIYEEMIEIFGKSSNYILTQVAIAKHNLRDVDSAIEIFQEIRSKDPFRLDAMDVYSNLLYVKDLRAELSILSHDMNSIDPFRVETCCCIANFYSLRNQHPKAVIYFSRALQLNPKHLSAWTLMGHEYMEMKNTSAAIQAYRSAIKCNKRDYRAWYGLGQTYEILNMNSYCLYYYTMARSLRPNDCRMSIAMGETLEKLNRNDDAIKCYWKSGGLALIKLANLYEKMGQKDKAAAAYTDYVIKTSQDPEEITSSIFSSSADLSASYKFLAKYHYDKRNFDEADVAANRCLDFPETKDWGRDYLNKILKVRAAPGLILISDHIMDDDNVTRGNSNGGPDDTPLDV